MGSAQRSCAPCGRFRLRPERSHGCPVRVQFLCQQRIHTHVLCLRETGAMGTRKRKRTAVVRPDARPEQIQVPCRRRLPDMRQSLTHKFSINGHEGYLIVGLFEDGRPGELFIRMAKEGSTMSGLADTIGILTSLALQYGVPVEALALKFERMRFEPSGWTKNPEIRQAHSISDYIFRWLGLTFSQAFREQLQAQAEVAEPTTP